MSLNTDQVYSEKQLKDIKIWENNFQTESLGPCFFYMGESKPYKSYVKKQGPRNIQIFFISFLVFSID